MSSREMPGKFASTSASGWPAARRSGINSTASRVPRITGLAGQHFGVNDDAIEP